ncbi:hypothetical protein THRCLA_22182 [Thraustotheca clavata]|uniref:Uncharacterized protein n=1 Tax=Thraustotheca clavata TaxID=74557 RepID=A0A1V9ZAK9_9STRA|nr:hypothetical protein THRCLA_22182 [Thraustotheca clavata]
MFVAVTIGWCCMPHYLPYSHEDKVIIILMCVKYSQRGFAMGICTFFLHLFGDVPSSVVIGALKDYWAPRCGSFWTQTEMIIGLRYTLCFAFRWHVYTVLLWKNLLHYCKKALLRGTA